VVTSLLVSPAPNLELSFRQRSVTDAFVSDGVFAPGFSIVDLRAAYDLGTLESYVSLLNALDEHDDPMRAGDERPTLGRIVAVGVLGTWPGEQE
jgi:hypothetical protein